jgi:hypothetical protein
VGASGAPGVSAGSGIGGSCRGVCSEVKDHVEQLSKMKECIVLLCCCAVVATLYMATIRVCLHDVSLMLVRVEGAHKGEGGALG